ncbi:MAG: hypothetical protein GWP02_04630, partial [Desulfobulbaceae bacterium]|nr:hypothetical protein [Desulfobulbaceae bacterium]
MAGLTSLGNDWDSIREGVVAQRSGICRIDDWARIDGLNTNLGGPLIGFEVPSHYKRKSVRSMGRVAQLSTTATERALSEAGLLSFRRLRVIQWAASGARWP